MPSGQHGSEAHLSRSAERINDDRAGVGVVLDEPHEAFDGDLRVIRVRPEEHRALPAAHLPSVSIPALHRPSVCGDGGPFAVLCRPGRGLGILPCRHHLTVGVGRSSALTQPSYPHLPARG